MCDVSSLVLMVVFRYCYAEISYWNLNPLESLVLMYGLKNTRSRLKDLQL